MSRTAHKLLSASGGKDYEIEQSVLFDQGDSPKLRRTPSSEGNRKTFTFSTWCKRSSLGMGGTDGTDYHYLFGAFVSAGGSTNDSHYFAFGFHREDQLFVGGWSTNWRATNRVFRDTSAWYHLVLQFDTTQATADNRIKLYVNGVQETSFSVNANPSQNYDVAINNTVQHAISDVAYDQGSGPYHFDGYMAETHFFDGAVVAPSEFGETDDVTGQWIPKKYVGTSSYGTNGFYLDFANDGVNGVTAAASTFTAPFGGTASNATADNGNYLISNTTTGGSFDLWHVDLGSAKTVSRVFQHNMKFTGGTSTFKLYSSDTNESYLTNWTERASFSVSSSYQDLTTYQNTAARYWKMRATAFGVNGTGHVDFVDVTIDGNSTFSDKSGQGNHFLPTNLANSDVYLDSPTNNFAVHNSEGSSTISSFTVGNLWGKSTGSNFAKIISTLAPTSGKWYCEYYITATASNGNIIGASTRAEGAVVDNSNQNGTSLNDETSWNLNHSTASYQRITRSSNSEVDSLGVVSVGDVCSIAIDADNSKVYFRKNNTIVGSSSGHTINTVEGGNRYFFTFHPRGSGWTGHGIANYGQNSSFNGNKSAQGNTDGNGIGDFYYSPPSGFLALCTKNLPTPAIRDPSAHFTNLLYAGNATEKTVSGVGFAPDYLWIKNRTYNYHHANVDSVRGANKLLSTSQTAGEYTTTEQVKAFTSDGFTVGDNSDSNHYVNVNNSNYIAWLWKANGSGSSNSDGAQTTTVSANTTAGFSIVACTGAGSSTTYGHGLGVTPKVVILKSRSGTDNWWFFSTAGDGTTDYYYINTTAAKTDSSTMANSTTFTTSFSNGATFIGYCFAEIEGYSKFATYLGNGSAIGPFINTGFKPAYILIKSHTDADNWHICDVARSPGNPHNDVLRANLHNEESANHASFDVDSYSNGFKIRSTNSELNTSAKRYIYMAFAEFPAKYANAR